MKMKKIKNKNIKGVSLIEALVSTAIIGIGFVAILQMTNYSVQSIHTSGERTKANSLINMIAEDVIGNKSAGISTENFSEFIKTKLQTDSNDLSKLCSSNAPKSQDSGNIYGTYDKTTAIAEFGEKRTASQMKLKKWKAILNSKDYMNYKGTNETRKFQIYKMAPSWSDLGDTENESIKDEVMYVGKIQFRLNDGNKTKSLFFQSDYKLKGPKDTEEDDFSELQGEEAGSGEGEGGGEGPKFGN